MILMKNWFHRLLSEIKHRLELDLVVYEILHGMNAQYKRANVHDEKQCSWLLSTFDEMVNRQ